MKRCLFVLVAAIFSSQVFAQNYPELQVSPLASARLKREAAKESSDVWSRHLPIQVSALATLAAGITANSDLDKDHDTKGVGPKIAMGVGAGWLIASFWMQSQYRPYSHGYSEVAHMPHQSPREQLAAERMAEEHIDETARTMRKIKWLSFGSNLLGSAYALSSAESESTGKAVSIVGVAASFIPLLFPYRAEQVSEDQHSYKKKVFGPITFGNDLIKDPFTNKTVLGMTATTTF